MGERLVDGFEPMDASGTHQPSEQKRDPGCLRVVDDPRIAVLERGIATLPSKRRQLLYFACRSCHVEAAQIHDRQTVGGMNDRGVVWGEDQEILDVPAAGDPK